MHIFLVSKADVQLLHVNLDKKPPKSNNEAYKIVSW